MATDHNKGKKPAGDQTPPGKPQKQTPAPSRKVGATGNPVDPYDIRRCDCCKIAGDICKDLDILKSKWRTTILCKKCLSLIESADICSYCFQPIQEEVSILACFDCSCCIHLTCLQNPDFYIPGRIFDPESDSFSCVDCNPIYYKEEEKCGTDQKPADHHPNSSSSTTSLPPKSKERAGKKKAKGKSSSSNTSKASSSPPKSAKKSSGKKGGSSDTSKVRSLAESAERPL